jgi:hypothetical protein
LLAPELQSWYGLQEDHDPLTVSAAFPAAGLPGMSVALTDPAVFLALVVSVPPPLSFDAGVVFDCHV